MADDETVVDGFLASVVFYECVVDESCFVCSDEKCFWCPLLCVEECDS